ncbi:cytochrome C oxidase subunit IV family protein [Pseudomonas jinjuensis]|uniref:Cytochrome C oxidase subunit IV n=1 Tax=Pseudomonas jinjuensis TaxID=198616 RepID=A0A1H0ITY4_9PSED|nr:cytochrome C oxidase subunit IV family protein [Pseudomonas jinjuensis]SDO34859.1 Cytochrome C oxidase subunit IV [Pseudomonas jinjuensis]
MRVLLLCWGVLLLLTVASVAAGSLGEHWAMLLALGGCVVKGWIISEHFMELRSAPRFWRFLLLAWPLLLTALIGTTLWLGMW